ncbi:MAG: 30S ribosomal protein S13 [Candidatus Heimdallarchaeota archaeon]
MGTTRVKVPEEEKEKKKEKKKVAKPVKAKPKELRVIVRVAGKDLDGEKPLIWALKGIKGISHSMSKAICNVSGFDPYVKLGSLTEKDIEKLEEIIKNPVKFGVPAWIVNRRKDIETGQDLHLTESDLDVARKFDIQRMIDLKTWKGVRHMFGQPVRGQRTRSTFRTGRSVGVVRKGAKVQQPSEKEKKK